MIFFAGCRFRILRFSSSAYFQLCLPRVPLVGSLASLPFCLWVPGFFRLCLSCVSSLCLVRLLWYFAPSLVLWVFCRSSSLVASCSLSIGLLWFLFILFITRSNLSSFATGSSLWAELSRMISLFTARHVGMLQAVAAAVSSPVKVCVFVFSSCFRALSASESPLFRVLSGSFFTDFVGSVPGVFLLCMVRALRVFLRCTSALSPRPRSIFVSPHCPYRSLSKNALSYFLHSVILQSLSLAPASSLPSTSSASLAASSASCSSFRAHSVRSVATSTAFARNVPVSSLLEAASCSSASVFTSFYLCNVQFEYAQGFSLGPFVAAGAVVYFYFLFLSHFTLRVFMYIYVLFWVFPHTGHVLFLYYR